MRREIRVVPETSRNEQIRQPDAIAAQQAGDDRLDVNGVVERQPYHRVVEGRNVSRNTHERTPGYRLLHDIRRRLDHLQLVIRHRSHQLTGSGDDVGDTGRRVRDEAKVDVRRNRFALGGLAEVVVVPLQHDPRPTRPTYEPIGPGADRVVGEIAGRIARVNGWQEHYPRSHQ